MPYYKKRLPQTGFTLLELTMVITIIGVLLAILLPTIGKTYDLTKTTQCLNNLRQIGLAMSMYMDDHEYKFPPLRLGNSVPWYKQLAAYADNKGIFKCPNYQYHDYDDIYHFSYGINSNLPNIDIQQVKATSKCIMVTAGYPIVLDPAKSMYFNSKGVDTFLRNRHGKGETILFVDGHSAWYRVSDIPVIGPESTLWWNQ